MSIKVFALNGSLAIRELPFFLAEDSLDNVSRQLPQGVYSTFRTFGGAQKVLELQAHLDRLFVPSAAKGIEPSVSVVDLRLGLKKLLEFYQSQEARVRICLSLSEQPGQIFVMLEPLKLLDERIYQQGVEVVTSHLERPDPRIKSTTFIQKSAQERISLLSKDIFEALIEKDGCILEGLTSNFYALKNSRMITARKGILLGVTRRVLLRLIRAEGVLIDYRPLRIAELSWISEAFITSSSRGVVPVVSIDGESVGQGQPGIFSKKLRSAYDIYVLEKAELI